MIKANIATPSLSKDPATDRDMYDGTVAIRAAAAKPAPFPRTSFTNPNVANAQKAENRGAVNTQTCMQSAHHT